MTNQYMTKLYHDLLSNSPQTVTIDIPADMGTGQISQVVTKQGAVVSDWKMNYFSDMNVQGVSCENYIQLLFCFNDGVSWNIADARQIAFFMLPLLFPLSFRWIDSSIKWNICVILGRKISFLRI